MDSIEAELGNAAFADVLCGILARLVPTRLPVEGVHFAMSRLATQYPTLFGHLDFYPCGYFSSSKALEEVLFNLKTWSIAEFPNPSHRDITIPKPRKQVLREFESGLRLTPGQEASLERLAREFEQFLDEYRVLRGKVANASDEPNAFHKPNTTIVDRGCG
jgi:hypothetical protein